MQLCRQEVGVSRSASCRMTHAWGAGRIKVCPLTVWEWRHRCHFSKLLPALDCAFSLQLSIAHVYSAEASSPQTVKWITPMFLLWDMFLWLFLTFCSQVSVPLPPFVFHRSAVAFSASKQLPSFLLFCSVFALLLQPTHLHLFNSKQFIVFRFKTLTVEADYEEDALR